jgi:hypothetical protein
MAEIVYWADILLILLKCIQKKQIKYFAEYRELARMEQST